MDYYYPFPQGTPRSQDYGANPGIGPNPPGGHNGDDWAVPVGTPVHAAGDGTVIWAGQFDDTYADNWGWNLNYGGIMVIINTDGADGPYFEYGHLSQALVSVGERVTGGQVIALSGDTDGGTGISTGPHCHVGCLEPAFDLGTDTYGRVNPRKYMNTWPDGLSVTVSPTTEQKEDDPMADLTDKQLQQIYRAVWFGVPGADLIPNEANGKGEWPYTTLGSMTARIGRDIVAPGLAALNQGDPKAIADRIVEAFGDDLAGEIVSAVGQRLAKVAG